jgi:hypothetical protein
VDLQPELGQTADVPHGVAGSEHVACLGVNPIQDVSRLEVGQAEAGDHVRAAHDQDREVDEEEQEGSARRQGGNEQNAGEDDDLDAPQHREGTLRR